MYAVPAPERRTAVAALARRLAAHCQRLVAPAGAASADVAAGAASVAAAQLLAQRCLAEAAGLAAALGAHFDAGALGVLLLHLTGVRPRLLFWSFCWDAHLLAVSLHAWVPSGRGRGAGGC